MNDMAIIYIYIYVLEKPFKKSVKNIPLSLLMVPHFFHPSSYSRWVLSTTKVVLIC